MHCAKCEIGNVIAVPSGTYGPDRGQEGSLQASPIKLVGFSGSLRKASYSTALLRAIAARLPTSVDMAISSLINIPSYNGDLEGEAMPVAVRALRETIHRAEGLILCSPEYNHGAPGLLLNAIDWASRPAFLSPLRDKPVLIMTASVASTGGVRAHPPLREALASTLSRVIMRPEVAVAAVHEKVVDGVFTDEGALRFALAAIDDLVSEIVSLQRAHIPDATAVRAAA